MSKSVHHDEQCLSLHAEGLTEGGIKIFMVPQGHLKINRVGRPLA